MNNNVNELNKTNKIFKIIDYIKLCNCFLKLVSAIFYQFFIFSPNDSPSKTMESVFYFIKKALFLLKIFKYLEFFPFLSTFFRYKRTNGSGIIYDVMNWFA